MDMREVQSWHEEQARECRREDDAQIRLFHEACVQALKDIEIALLRHTTDGGAVYLTDAHDFFNATTILRLDGGVELIACGASA